MDKRLRPSPIFYVALLCFDVLDVGTKQLEQLYCSVYYAFASIGQRHFQHKQAIPSPRLGFLRDVFLANHLVLKLNQNNQKIVHIPTKTNNTNNLSQTAIFPSSVFNAPDNGIPAGIL